MNEQIDKWISATCEYFDFSKNMLLGRKRSRLLSDARSVAMWLLYYSVGLTYKHIGEIFDGRSHSMVIHAVNNVDIGYASAVKDLAAKENQREMAI